jgi:hypothetical protein
MGSLFSNLTHTGVQQPNGQTSFQNNPAATGQALALASAATAQPNTSNVDGTLNPDTYTQEVAGGPLTKQSSDNTTVTQNAPPVTAQPRVVTPSFGQANDGGTNPFSSALTTKGKVLSGLLVAMQGAARGAAASVPTNPHISPGIGPALAAGVETPFAMKQQQNELEKEGAQNKLIASQISMAPLQRMKMMSDIRKDQVVTPRSGGVFDTTTNAYVPGTEPQDKNQNVDNLIAAASARALANGVDPSKDPTVQQLSAVKAASAKVPDADQPLGARVPQLNAALQSRYQVLNPKQPLPQSLMLPPDATGKDFDRVDKMMQQTEQSSATKAQQDAANSIRQQTLALAQQGRGDARLDKSYQFNQAKLDKARTPIDQLSARFGRLQDTLAQGSPQADALVAPELLTVMAGGQGSGLRMNEAEIARVVGGRNKWQDLQAAVNKWKTDPNAANSITPDQRAQIHALITVVGQKITGKQQILSDAQDQLLGAPDVNSHRRILADTQNKLDRIDAGKGGAVQVTAPDGSVHTFADAASANNFKQMAGIK